MVKEAFQRLSPERQEELLYKGMMLYLKNPYDQVTVRMLAAAMEINMATFYRYFDEKEDLSLLILSASTYRLRRIGSLRSFRRWSFRRRNKRTSIGCSLGRTMRFSGRTLRERWNATCR